jgi:4-alpha-glucanotransferase
MDRSSSYGRLSGVLLPVFSLRSRSDFGIGDFGALDDFFRWMRQARQKMLLLLPLLPTLPSDPSPYATRSAFGLNPLFIDLSQVASLFGAEEAQRLSAAEAEQLEEARRSPRIRYQLVVPLKNQILKRTFDHFVLNHLNRGSRPALEFQQYQERESWWLDSFALYCAIWDSQQHRPWWEWPEALREREQGALATERQRLDSQVLFYRWQQWVAEMQWEIVRRCAKQRGVILCGDEPFIVGRDSADAWSNPHLLKTDARLGVPPDEFSATGQDWGLPYFDFGAMETDGFSWLKRRAEKSAAYYDLSRVDHAVGYFRQWIRTSEDPNGRFIPSDELSQQAQGEKLFRMLAESAGIIAEDLGVIPSFVRKTLTKLGIPGYRVLRWEKDKNHYRDPHQFPPLSLVTTGTHDTETLSEWWESLSEEERGAVASAYPELKGDQWTSQFTEEVHQSLLASAENAGSDLCILPWQDVLGTKDRINLPGSQAEGNWTYRIAQPVEDMPTRKETNTWAQRLGRLAEFAGR